MSMESRYENRIVWTDLFIATFDNPITSRSYDLGNLSTGNGLVRAIIPRACKLVGYSISTLCIADTIAGNWILAIRKNGSNISLIQVNVTTTETVQTAATVPWDVQGIWEAGDAWEANIGGSTKSGFFSFLCLEWELI